MSDYFSSGLYKRDKKIRELERHQMDKPKRLTKIEDYHKDSSALVEFEESDAGHWVVRIEGFLLDFEVNEINKALKAANKAGVL